jgi:basic amino acid/polyamine antiporter, APA family
MTEKDNVELISASPAGHHGGQHLRRASLTLADDPEALAGSSAEVHNPLKRTLTAVDLTMLGVSGIVGAGIYTLSGSAAALYAGPAVSLSFIIAAIGCAFSCLCYSELAALLPVAGSAYSFSTATLGVFVGFVIGWDLTLEYLVGVATVSVGWSGYFVSALKDIGLELPTVISKGPLQWDTEEETWKSTGGLINLPAVFIIACLAAVNVVGIQESARFTRFVVGAKIVVLLIFIFVGAFYVKPSNWSPFIPPAGDSFGEYGATGVLRASSVLFFSFIGADSVSTASQEAKNPQRDVPIGTLASLGLCSLLYIAVGFVLTGLVSYEALNVPDPIAVAVNAAGEGLFWLRPLVKCGALLGLTSVIMVLILGQSRVWFALSQDGNLSPFLSRVHHKYRTPHKAILLCALVAAVMAAITPIDVLGEMVSIGTLFAFVLVCAGVLVLRKTKPHLHRPFRTPWVPFVPIMGILTASLQMVFLPWGTWLRLVIWLLVGLIVYHTYSKKHMLPLEQRMVMLLGMNAAKQMMAAEGEKDGLKDAASSAAGGASTAGGAEEDEWAPAFSPSPVIASGAAATVQAPLPHPPPGVASSRPTAATHPTLPVSAPAPAPASAMVIPKARQAVASTSLFAAQSDIGLVPLSSRNAHAASSSTISGRDYWDNIQQLEGHNADSSLVVAPPASVVVPPDDSPSNGEGDRSPAVTSGLLASSFSSSSSSAAAVASHASPFEEHEEQHQPAVVALEHVAAVAVSADGKLVSPGASGGHSGGGGLIGSISRRLSKVGGRPSSHYNSATDDGTGSARADGNHLEGDGDHNDPFGLQDGDGDKEEGSAEAAHPAPAPAARKRRPSIAETVASLAASVVAAVAADTVVKSSRSRANSQAAEATAITTTAPATNHAAAAEVLATFDDHHDDGHHHLAAAAPAVSSSAAFFVAQQAASNDNNGDDNVFEFAPPPATQHQQHEEGVASAAAPPSGESHATKQEEWW